MLGKEVVAITTQETANNMLTDHIAQVVINDLFSSKLKTHSIYYSRRILHSPFFVELK